MKIRTDFVTNSSSSSFVLQIRINKTDGETLECELRSGEEETYGELKVTRSPYEMGQCTSVQELTEILRTSVIWPGVNIMNEDEGFDELPDFIGEVEEFIGSMDEIKSISIEKNVECHSDAWRCETYTYYRDRDKTEYNEDQYPEDDDSWMIPDDFWDDTVVFEFGDDNEDEDKDRIPLVDLEMLRQREAEAPQQKAEKQATVHRTAQEREQARRRRWEEKQRQAEEARRLKEAECRKRYEAKLQAEAEKRRQQAEKAQARAEQRRLAEEAKAQKEQARQEVAANAVILYAPGDEPEKLRKRLDTLFEKLDGAYPDRKISRLSQDHKKWGEVATEIYRLLGYSDRRAFLEAYGYTRNSGHRWAADIR